MPDLHRKHGFTLIELSIVLVIIGLLVGGVLAGQSMIRASNLRAITSEYQSYVTAIGAFKDKYSAIPGDMPTATTFWGAQAGSTTAEGVDSTCAALTAPATSTATCNGDNNGFVSGFNQTPNTHELFRSWQQLANAGLITGTYTGVRGEPSAGAGYGVGGVNLPQSKYPKGAWSLIGWGFIATQTFGAMPSDYGNVLMIGAAYTPSKVQMPFWPLLRAEDLYNLDVKLDDGKPNTGRVMTFSTYEGPDCLVGTNDAYLLTSTVEAACAGLFKSGF